MPQSEINAKWLVDYSTNVGTCTILTPPSPSKPVAGLRKPYQYVLAKDRCEALVKSVGGLKRTVGGGNLQIFLIDTKPLRYGIRFHLFLLGYRPGLVYHPPPYTRDYQPAPEGVSDFTWNQLTRLINRCLEECLGESLMYVEPWSQIEKFQARLETYIAYQKD